jgi:hypothetical protein
VKAIPVADLPSTVLVLAWSRSVPTPQLAALITTAKAAAPEYLHRSKAS